MALTNDDKKWIIETISEIVVKSEYNLRDEITRLRADTNDGIEHVDSNVNNLRLDMRDEVSSIRSSLRSIEGELKQLREELANINEDRTEDGDLAFSEITKYAKQIEKLEKRLAKVEKQLA
jgi:predicted  nucleic acid-binding Zn-ribbon protein